MRIMKLTKLNNMYQVNIKKSEHGYSISGDTRQVHSIVRFSNHGGIFMRENKTWEIPVVNIQRLIHTLESNSVVVHLGMDKVPSASEGNDYVQDPGEVQADLFCQQNNI